MSAPTLPAAAVEETVAELRAFFESGATRPIGWRETQLRNLRTMLRRHGPELAAALAADLGKAPTETHLTEVGVVCAEIDHALRNLRSWLAPERVPVPASHRPARASVVYEPLGVMLVIAPWNYPVQLLLAPLVGALGAGNTVVLKPSELAPTVSETLARLVPRYVAGVAVVEGGKQAAGALLEQRFDHIVYTGGARVARVVMRAAAQHLTPVTLELGGKSPVWVDASTNLRTAARRVAWAKYVNAGQTCVAPDYLLARPEVAAALEPLLVQAVREMYGPDPRTSADYGRIVSTEHHERLVRVLGESLEAGARLVTGGQATAEDRYLAPTVLADVAVDSPIMAEEIFGPVLPIVPVADLAEAVRIVRSGEKPLALYAFTQDSATRRTWLRDTSSGAVGFDAAAIHVAVPGLPFGGVGGSGMGSYHGRHSVRTFSHAKPVLRKPLAPDTLGLVRAPYTRAKDLVARLLL